MTGSGKTISFEYNADGLRVSKTVDGVVHNYVYSGGKLVQETYGDTKLDFSYDAYGNPYTFTYSDGTISFVYHYVLNMQGDVVRLVTDDGITVATYAYDAWGNITNMESTNETLANANPLRYRGYYYDRETGLYYLQSRYYNPQWGRFINADGYISTGQGILGNNMFAYCINNPVNMTDNTGMRCVHIMSRIWGGSGASQEAAMSTYGANTENMLQFFGVSSVDDLPTLPAGAMVFLENTTVLQIGIISVIHGRTIVMDCEKYCEYTFSGIGGPSVGYPYDYTETKGYVYGVESISDYNGLFLGGSFNYLANITGRAFAFNGVTADIISGCGYLSASMGTSITYYGTPQSDWIYGKASIYWHQPTPYYYYAIPGNASPTV